MGRLVSNAPPKQPEVKGQEFAADAFAKESIAAGGASALLCRTEGSEVVFGSALSLPVVQVYATEHELCSESG